MKTISSKHIGKSLIALAFAGLSGAAFAADTWNLNILNNSSCGATVASGGAGVNEGTTLSGCATTAVTGNNYAGTATVSGWSTGSGTGATSSTAGSTFAAASIWNWGEGAGVGVVATNESSGPAGPHAFDNKYGIDAMIVGFTGKVNLSSLTIGWNGTDNGVTGYTDSDLSVYVWTGAGAPTANGVLMPGTVGSTTALAAGWALVSAYSNVGLMSGNKVNPISSPIYSSYWLIGAFNTADGNNDAFKLMSVAGGTCAGTVGASGLCTTTTSKVPEPGSLALLGASLIGFIASRRRKPVALAA